MTTHTTINENWWQGRRWRGAPRRTCGRRTREFVTGVTVSIVSDQSGARWLVVWVRLSGEPSRHRVAVWRELRRTGAVPLGQGAWVVPAAPVFTEGVQRAVELAERGDGEVVVLSAAGRSEADESRLAAMFTAEREQEWAEFLADCGKFVAEIEKEIGQRKFTVAELEEEEQSLER